LIDGENIRIPIDKAIAAKVVGLLFASDAAPTCRALKPKLVRVYTELKADTKPFEIVLVSLDRDEKAFHSSMASVPWVAVPWADSDTRSALAARFGVTEAPALIFFGEDGKVSNNHGIVAIETEGARGYPFHKDAAAEAKDKETFDAGVLELFNAIDINKDKVVTRGEILKTLQSGNVPGPMIESFAQQIMADVDKDASASLTLDEWQAYFASLASRMGGVFPLDGFRKMFGLKPTGRRSSSPAKSPKLGAAPSPKAPVAHAKVAAATATPHAKP